MSWEKAQAYFEQCPHLGSVEEAYAELNPPKKVKVKHLCPRCSKKLKSPEGVVKHMMCVHKDHKGAIATLKYIEEHQNGT